MLKIKLTFLFHLLWVIQDLGIIFLKICDSDLETADFRLETADFRLEIADFCLETADLR
jgi:hypothetical protein